MLRRCAVFLAMAAVVSLAFACGNTLPAPAASVFDAAEELEIFTIQSTMETQGEPFPPDTILLQGHRVVASAIVKDSAQRQEITRIVNSGIDPDTFPASCFIPRHALRAKRAGKVVELVICYQCQQIQIFVNGSRIETITTNNVQAELDAAFARAGLRSRD